MTGDPAAVQAYMEQQAPMVVGSLWKINVVDIEATLKAVCTAVCAEAGQSAAVLKARAAALRSLGVIFQVRHAGRGDGSVMSHHLACSE